jgi:hypothetical protein
MPVSVVVFESPLSFNNLLSSSETLGIIDLRSCVLYARCACFRGIGVCFDIKKESACMDVHGNSCVCVCVCVCVMCMRVCVCVCVTLCVCVCEQM